MKHITPQDTAKIMGKSYDFVVSSLQGGTCPFGFATRHEGGRWGYYISPKKLAEWVDPEEIEAYFGEKEE